MLSPLTQRWPRLDHGKASLGLKVICIAEDTRSSSSRVNKHRMNMDGLSLRMEDKEKR